jgi:pseudaminic acid cytidylyltransferase
MDPIGKEKSLKKQVDVIIPARIGSKRLPKKNIKELNGVPAIVRTIRNLKESGIFENIIVSTDSDEVREVCRPEKIICETLRPPELSNDLTPILEVMRYELALNTGSENTDRITACVFPTAFLISPNDYVSSYEQFSHGARDNFLICASSYRHPIERALIKTADGRFAMKNPDFRFTRTQDLPKSYYDLGQFYFARNEIWRFTNDVFAGCDCYFVDSNKVFDIDDEEDWKLAEEQVLINECNKVKKTSS